MQLPDYLRHEMERQIQKTVNDKMQDVNREIRSLMANMAKELVREIASQSGNYGNTSQNGGWIGSIFSGIFGNSGLNFSSSQTSARNAETINYAQRDL